MAAVAIGGGLAYALVFMAAESLTRRAFPHQPQLWRVWSREAGASRAVLGRTLGGYGFVPLELALVAGFYYATNRWLGWWQPSEVLTDPNILSSAVPALMPIAVSLQAGFMEECLFRAVPLALGALIGAHFGHRRSGIAIAFVLQAVIFGGAHANYPGFPSYSRLVELVVPSMLWAAIFLRFGLLPTILLHALFDLALFSIPLFLVDAPGAGSSARRCSPPRLVPLGVVLWRRAKAGAWGELPEALRNRAWMPRRRAAGATAATPRVTRPRAARSSSSARCPMLGLAGLVAGSRSRRCARTRLPSGSIVRRRGGRRRRRIEGARRRARARMAPLLDGARGERRPPVDAAQVRVARGGPRGLPRADRQRRSRRRSGTCATRCSTATSPRAPRSGG